MAPRAILKTVFLVGSSSAQPETLQQAKIMAMTTIDVFLQAEEILPKIKKAFLEDIKIDGKYE